MVAVFFVFRFSLTSYYFNNAEDTFKESLKLEQQEKATAYANALEQIGHVLKLRPKHAKALDLKGELLYRQWWLEPDGQYLSDSKLLQESKKFHEKALTIRKEWPFTMLQLTRIEAHKPSLDNDFYLRFDQTYEFGRFEAAIASDLMKLGILRWKELRQNTKESVVELTNLSVQQKRNSLSEIRKILQGAELQEYMCSRIEKNDRQAYLCNETNDDQKL